MKFLRDKLQTTLKVINLLNQDIQSHVFGDILKTAIRTQVSGQKFKMRPKINTITYRSGRSGKFEQT